MVYSALVEQAHENGIFNLTAQAIAKRGSLILLIPREEGGYRFPAKKLEENETLSHALQRGMEKSTGLGLSGVEKYIGYLDGEGRRTFYFLVEIEEGDPATNGSYAWVTPSEAIEYPVEDETRQALILLLRALGEL